MFHSETPHWPAVSSLLPPLHWLGLSCASVSGQRAALWLPAVYLKWPVAGVSVSFSQTIYKAPVPFCCPPSLQPASPGFPSRPFMRLATVVLCISVTFQLQLFIFLWFTLLCLPLAAQQVVRKAGLNVASERHFGCSMLMPRINEIGLDHFWTTNKRSFCHSALLTCFWVSICCDDFKSLCLGSVVSSDLCLNTPHI